jgi:hypothetical protein
MACARVFGRTVFRLRAICNTVTPLELFAETARRSAAISSFERRASTNRGVSKDYVMHKLTRVIAIAVPFLVMAACMADEDATTDDQDGQSAEIASAATQPIDWTADDLSDTAQDVNPATCRRLVSFNETSCPSGFVCLWQNTEHKGFGVAESSGCNIANMQNIACQITKNGVTHVFPCNNGNGTFNDEMSSWNNATSQDFCYFTNAQFKPTPGVRMKAGANRNQLESGNNDKASSLRPASKGGC